MANNESAKKRVRVTQVKTLRNKAQKSAMRTALKSFNSAVLAGEKEKAGSLLNRAYRVLDKAAAKGIIHKNQASRRKARLARNLANL